MILLLCAGVSKTNGRRKRKGAWENKGLERLRVDYQAWHTKHALTLHSQLIPIDAWMNEWLICQLQSPAHSQQHKGAVLWVK